MPPGRIEMTMREALTKAAAQFRDYQRQHRAKGTSDGDIKADTNARFALMCELALGEPATPPSDALVEEVAMVIAYEVGEKPVFTAPTLYPNSAREKWRITARAILQLPSLADRTGRDAAVEAARKAVINSPETADFMSAVPLEAAHQRERWGVDHDAGKSPFDWFWLIGYLAQKAADAAVRGDVEKAKHHTISTGAALANWHAALSGKDSRFQPGITPKPAEIVV